MDEPAPPDVAARRATTACCSSSRSACASRSSPAATCSGSLRRLRRGVAPPREADGVCTCSRRSCCRCTRFAAVRALNARLLPWLVRRAARAAGHVRARSCGPTSRRPRRCSTRSTRRSSSTTASTTSPPRRASTRASFRAAEERFAARADLVLASAPSLAERMRTLSGNVLDAPNVADTALLRAPRSTTGRSTPRSTRCRGPRIVFTGAVVGDEARPRRCSWRSRALRPRLVDRARRPGRRRRPAHRRLGAATPSRTSTCSAARAYDELPGRAARRRRGADPLRAQRADRERSSR